MRFEVWGWGFGVWGLGFEVWVLGFGIWGLGVCVWGLGGGVEAWGFTEETDTVREKHLLPMIRNDTMQYAPPSWLCLIRGPSS